MNTTNKIRIPTECISWRWNGNLGDDLIFAAQEEMFKNECELDQYIKNPGAVLIGGGTFIPKSPENPELLDLSKTLTTIVFGTGVGETKFWGEEFIPEWKEIINNSDFIGVRGPISLQYLVYWGLNPDRMEWIGDVALYFAEPRKITKKYSRKIAVNLGITYGQLNGFDEQHVEREIISLLKVLDKDGWEITLVSAWQPDDAVLHRIREIIPSCLIEYWHDDYKRALESVKQFDLVLCEKLHVGVVAACRNVPFIALN